MKYLFALLLTLTACQPETPSRLEDASSLKSLEAQLLETTVKCQDASNCPESAALVMVRGVQGQMTSCSGFLVAPDMIATARSCLPKELPSCSTQVGVKFPQSGSHSAESHLCHEQLPSEAKSDLILIRLKQKLQREPFRLASPGIHLNQPLLAYSMRPSAHGFELTALNCQHTTNRSLSSLWQHPGYPHLSVIGCSQAAPGSALMDLAGSVSAMYLGSAKQFEPLHASYMSGQFALNLACRTWPPQVKAPIARGPLCAESDLDRVVDHGSTEALKNALIAWEDRQPPIFLYEFSSATARDMLIISRTIKCIKPVEQWRNHAAYTNRSEGQLRRIDAQISDLMIEKTLEDDPSGGQKISTKIFNEPRHKLTVRLEQIRFEESAVGEIHTFTRRPFMSRWCTRDEMQNR